MSNLTQIIEQIKSEIKIDENGKGFASIRATARLAGIDQSELGKSLKSSEGLEPSKLATFLIEQGFESEGLKQCGVTGVQDLLVAAILEYYTFHAGRYCKEQAKQVYRVFAAIGVRTWMQEVTGYQKPVEPVKQLIPGDIRVVNFVNTLKELGCDITNPRFNQELQDFALDVAIGYKAIKSSSESKETWLGVAERAEQLGYQVSLVTQNRSQLGKYVKACGLASTKEKRLCNGTQREINLYLLTDELDKAIKEFMGAKTLAA
jgi:hypothetical protein